jgi:hypothetical protein
LLSLLLELLLSRLSMILIVDNILSPIMRDSLQLLRIDIIIETMVRTSMSTSWISIDHGHSHVLRMALHVSRGMSLNMSHGGSGWDWDWHVLNESGLRLSSCLLMDDHSVSVRASWKCRQNELLRSPSEETSLMQELPWM